MDNADMLESLIAGADAVTKRVHAHMKSKTELPIANADAKTNEALTRFGVVLGDVLPERGGLFRAVTLPAGWSVTSSDHYMYSNLRDEKGRNRALIGYKAADSWASIVLARRFDVTYAKDDWNDDKSMVLPCVVDSDKNELWRGAGIPPTDRSDPEWFNKPSASDLAIRFAEATIRLYAPDWRSVEAYWGEDGDKIAWPPHLTPPDTRETYTLHVSCYRDENRVDGGVQATVKAADVEEASEKLESSLQGLLGFYDQVKWLIRCKDVTVKSGVETTRRRGVIEKMSFGEYMDFTEMRFHRFR